jgi:chromosome segregation ATPase
LGMATVTELTKAIEEREAELKELQADLPKMRRLTAEATLEASNAGRGTPINKRLELNDRRQRLTGVVNQLEDDVEAVREEIAGLRAELAAAEEEERVEKVVAWAKERNAEAARLFAEALEPLQQAQRMFNQVHETLQMETSMAGGVGSERGSKLTLPTHPFSRVVIQIPGGGRPPLEMYVERLKQHQSAAFKGR